MMLPVFPVLLLVTALGSILLYQRTSHDIFWVLAVGSAVVCLIWGLVIAHWSIHLLTLIFLLAVRSPSRIAKVVQVNK